MLAYKLLKNGEICHMMTNKDKEIDFVCVIGKEE